MSNHKCYFCGCNGGGVMLEPECECVDVCEECLQDIADRETGLRLKVKMLEVENSRLLEKIRKYREEFENLADVTARLYHASIG